MVDINYINRIMINVWFVWTRCSAQKTVLYSVFLSWIIKGSDRRPETKQGKIVEFMQIVPTSLPVYY